MPEPLTSEPANVLVAADEAESVIANAEPVVITPPELPVSVPRATVPVEARSIESVPLLTARPFPAAPRPAAFWMTSRLVALERTVVPV